jgi:hypothetical protein
MNFGDENSLIRFMIRLLEQSEIPYMVTGSVASFLYGEPRATNDVDMIIAPTQDQLETLLKELEPHAYVSREAAEEAFRRRTMFNVIGFETAEKIDFILLKDRAFQLEEFGRRQKHILSAFEFTAVTAEDSILSKLVWAKRGQSERQLRDVYGVIKNQETLDWVYIDYWAQRLGVEESLNILKSKSSRDSAT